MIGNIINTALGLWLVSTAVLTPGALVGGRGALIEIVAGAVIAALAWSAKRSDYDGWHSRVHVTLAVLLAIVGVAGFAFAAPQLLVSWLVFWAGLLTAISSLWAFFYGRTKAAEA